MRGPTGTQIVRCCAACVTPNVHAPAKWPGGKRSIKGIGPPSSTLTGGYAALKQLAAPKPGLAPVNNTYRRAALTKFPLMGRRRQRADRSVRVRRSPGAALSQVSSASKKAMRKQCETVMWVAGVGPWSCVGLTTS